MIQAVDGDVTQRIAETELNEFICEDRDASHYVGPKQ